MLKSIYLLSLVLGVILVSILYPKIQTDTNHAIELAAFDVSQPTLTWYQTVVVGEDVYLLPSVVTSDGQDLLSYNTRSKTSSKSEIQTPVGFPRATIDCKLPGRAVYRNGDNIFFVEFGNQHPALEVSDQISQDSCQTSTTQQPGDCDDDDLVFLSINSSNRDALVRICGSKIDYVTNTLILPFSGNGFSGAASNERLAVTQANRENISHLYSSNFPGRPVYLLDLAEQKYEEIVIKGLVSAAEVRRTAGGYHPFDLFVGSYSNAIFTQGKIKILSDTGVKFSVTNLNAIPAMSDDSNWIYSANVNRSGQIVLIKIFMGE